MLYAIGAVILLAVVGVFWLRVMRNRPPRFDEDAIGTEVTVGRDGLAGQRVGTIRWRGTLVPAQLDPKAGILVMPEGTRVMIREVSMGVAIVGPKN